MSRYEKYGNYDLNPALPIAGRTDAWQGWAEIWPAVFGSAKGKGNRLCFDSYQGVFLEEVAEALQAFQPGIDVIYTEEAFQSPEEIRAMVHPDVTDDVLFGYLTRLNLSDYWDPNRRAVLERRAAANRLERWTAVLGPGAGLFAEEGDPVLYGDVARWEIQQRQRAGLLSNLGVRNRGASAKAQYKQSYFVDWRVLDRHKQATWDRWDWVLDLNRREDGRQQPLMTSAETFFIALEQTSRRPFRLKPFFDPGVWGGQWMRDVCGLEPEAPNYAWCFDCVPEENSLCWRIGEHVFEFPSVNLVFARPEELLGEPVHARFGKEFPIRFDFLDTMGGQNLSLQVHPLTEYIQERFGMHYTQDESYYILDAEEGAVVYLGLREGIDPDAMMADLEKAQENPPFPDEKYINQWPAKPHDHFLIPAGTVHCSGQGSMVLEISATPYIFTFKLWDWNRLDLDGKPRPINLEHGRRNIVWERTASWVGRNLINRVEPLPEASSEAVRAERTGLHEREFIETRRYWFTGVSRHDTGGRERGSVQVLNLVDGEAALVKSPDGAFEPFTVHYAETFVIPAGVGCYTIEPHPDCPVQRGAVLEASVRLGL